MTVKEAARRLELHPSTVYDLVWSGQLAHRRLGPRKGKIVIADEAIDDYLKRAQVAGNQRPQGEMKHIKI